MANQSLKQGLPTKDIIVCNEKTERFESLLLSCDRNGMEGLIEWIRKSDFYTAPASTRYHSCHEGGLLEHTLNVIDCLLAKYDNPTWMKALKEIDKKSAIIAAGTHDICKANFYGSELRNKKIYSDTGTKSDSNGRFDWVTVPSYIIDDQAPFGHGEKSVMIAQQFINLKRAEMYAIRWHMGFTEPKENWNTLSTAIRQYPFILALHEADLEATYLLEKEE